MKKFIFSLLVIFLSMFGILTVKLVAQEVSLAGVFTLNPSGKTPLSGVYTLSQTTTNFITIHIKGKTPSMDIIYTSIFDDGKVPIHGLYPDSTNTVILTSKKTSITNTIITEPSVYKSVEVLIDKNKAPDPKNQDIYFVNQGLKGAPIDDRHIIVGYDRLGDVRYINRTQKLHYMMNSNENILIRNNSGVEDLLGNSLVKYNKKIDVHHDSLQLESNRQVVLSTSTWGIEDRVTELDNNGAILRDLTFGSLLRDIVTDPEEIKIMDQFLFDSKNIYQKDGKKTGIDWAHANSLVYDKQNDIIYFSLRHQGVFAVDYSEWKLIWWMADDTLETIHEGVPNRGVDILELPSLRPYRVQGDAILDGPKNQHALFLFKNGNIGMFDNSGDGWVRTNGSRYVEYKVVQIGGQWTATKTREYLDPELYSMITSDIDLLPNKNLLIAWGVPGVIREVDKDNNIMFDMNAFHEWYFYRVDKMPLYPYENSKLYSIDANEVDNY